MDKLYGQYQQLEQRYDHFLKELASMYEGSPAMFFIASRHQVISMTEVKNGQFTNTMLDDAYYLIDQYESLAPTSDFGQMVLYSQKINITESEDSEHIYLGFVTTQLNKTIVYQYFKGLINGFHSFIYLRPERNKFLLNAHDLLQATNYQFEFSSLSHALIQYYEQAGNGCLSIIEKYEDEFIPFHPHLSINHKALTEAFIHDADRSPNEPIFIKNRLILNNQLSHHLIYKIVARGEMAFFLVFSFDSYQKALREKHTHTKWLQDIIPLLKNGYLHENRLKKNQRKDNLLQVTKKFLSTMNIGEVLEEIVSAIQKAFPTFKINLMLSHEWKVSEELSIKPLINGANNGNTMAGHAFLTGQIQIEIENRGYSKTLYVPLRGKQGVYGIMEIKNYEKIRLPKYEIEFIQMLADTGGSALENAELYQQSHNLIHDLQLINETSHQLNLNLRLADTIKFMTQQIIHSFEAEEVGFIMFHKNGEPIVLNESSSFFASEDILKKLEPYIQKIKSDKDAIYFGDTHTQPDFYLEDYQSVLVVPMIQSKQLVGMVLTTHSKSYHFTFEDFKLLQSLIHHSTLAFTNSMLHEELEKLVITDYLTKLYARNHLDEMIQHSMTEDKEGTFLLLDIDDFKEINDSFGHQVGDDIIIQIANIMKKSVREDDIVARWGGEELAIYLPRMNVETGEKIAKRIVKAVSLETSPKVTASMGVSYWSYEDEDRTLKKLFNEADKALYQAKENGKNEVVVKST